MCLRNKSKLLVAHFSGNGDSHTSAAPAQDCKYAMRISIGIVGIPRIKLGMIL